MRPSDLRLKTHMPRQASERELKSSNGDYGGGSVNSKQRATIHLVISATAAYASAVAGVGAYGYRSYYGYSSPASCGYVPYGFSYAAPCGYYSSSYAAPYGYSYAAPNSYYGPSSYFRQP
jgi:hypothetical protein